MTTTTNFQILAKPLEFRQGLREERQAKPAQRSLGQCKAETEPEARLWKLCAEAAPPRLSGAEWIALLLLGASALAALAFCFSEWLHLFNSGALDQTVRRFSTGDYRSATISLVGNGAGQDASGDPSCPVALISI
jgi:hypothetical protein